MHKSPIFVGWAAVSSQPQASEEKISLAEQLYNNILHSRRYGEMLCQLIVPGESRSIAKFDDAARIVSGWIMTESFCNLTGDELLRAIDSQLRAFQSIDAINPYAELEKLIDNAAFNVFVFRNLGRVGRSAALSMTIMELCHRADIITYATSSPPQSLDNAGDTYHKALIDAITAVGYENEIRQLMESHKTGIIRRVEGGRFPGRIPFGYAAIRNDRGKITGYRIVEEEAQTIRLIVRMYLDDQLGTPAIADYLNANSIKAPDGNTWAKNSVLVILKRAGVYAGTNEVNRRSKKRPLIKAPGKWEPIISKNDADRIASEFKARRHFGRSANFVHRYSRMVFCDICGARCRVQNTTMKRIRADGSEWQKRLTRYQCNHHGGLAEWKITEVLRTCIPMYTADGNIPDAPRSNTTADIITEIESINRQIATTKSGIERADHDYYITGSIDAGRHSAITKAANTRVERLMADITRLQDALQEEEMSELTAERLDDIRNNGLEMLELPDARKANAWLRQYFRVRIAGDRIVSVGRA